MKYTRCKTMLLGLLLAGSTSFVACKDKDKETTDTTTTAPAGEPAQTTAPVVVNEDDTLRKGVTDATKDYPGVTATVDNGEITLTGDVERSRLPNLMQSLNSLRPKKINNNLNVK